MISLSTEVLAVLGKDAASPEVERIVREYGLTDVQEDPPFRRYVGSTALGLSLLFDHERLIDAADLPKATAAAGLSQFYHRNDSPTRSGFYARHRRLW
jgi:hypothetical protein